MSGVILAQAPAPLVQETFLASLPFMQERGEVQLRSLVRAGGTRSAPTFGVPFEVELGLTDALELTFESGGSRYDRPDGWTSPSSADFGFGLRFGGYGAFGRLHSALSLEVASAVGDAGGEGRTTSISSGIQLGVDVARLRSMHLFTSASFSRAADNAADHEVEWNAGAVIPFGAFRGTLERSLVSAAGVERMTMPGIIWKVGAGWEVGLATTVRAQPRFHARGLLLSALVEF